MEKYFDKVSKNAVGFLAQAFEEEVANLHRELENCKNFEDVCRLQGQIKAYKKLLSYTDFVKNNKKVVDKSS